MNPWLKRLLIASISLSILAGCATTEYRNTCIDLPTPENQKDCDENPDKQKRKNDEDDMGRMD